MKMKNMLIGGMSLALVACISVGGTLAYMTAKSEKLTNTFTMVTNGIEMQLLEDADAVAREQVYKQNNGTDAVKDDPDGITYTNLIKGSEVSKKPHITMKDTDTPSHVYVCVYNTAGTNITLSGADSIWKLVETTSLEEGMTMYRYGDVTTTVQGGPLNNTDGTPAYVFTTATISQDAVATAVNASSIKIRAYAVQDGVGMDFDDLAETYFADETIWNS